MLGVAWTTLPALVYLAARILIDLPTLLDRYYVFALPGACLLAALGLRALERRWRPAVPLLLLLAVALSLPDQVAVRAVDAHRPDLYLLGQLLRQPELAGLPVVVPNQGVRDVVNAATYPDEVVAPTTAPIEPVAIVVRRDKMTPFSERLPYLAPGSPWHPAVQCRLGSLVVFEVVVVEGGGLPMGDSDALAELLRERVPGSGCAPSGSGMRRLVAPLAGDPSRRLKCRRAVVVPGPPAAPTAGG